MKNCLLGIENGILEGNKLQDATRLLDREQHYELLQEKTIIGNFKTIWKKNFVNGVVIPSKVRSLENCYETVIKMSENCGGRICQPTEVGANLKKLKRKPSEESQLKKLDRCYLTTLFNFVFMFFFVRLPATHRSLFNCRFASRREKYTQKYR